MREHGPSNILISADQSWDPEKPGETGPVVILHQRADEAFSDTNPGHAFGPFLDLESAIEFIYEMDEAGKAEGREPDDCFKTIMPLRVPSNAIVADATTFTKDVVGNDGGIDRELVGAVIEIVKRPEPTREQVRRDAQN